MKLAVFDIDDTLYLERDYARSGFGTVGRWLALQHGIAGFGELAWQLFEEGCRGRIFDEALQRLGASVDSAFVAELVGRYREHEPTIELLPDARGLLERLQGRVLMAVVTDGPEPSQAAKVAALGLETWCAPVVLTARLGPGCGKPSTVPFMLVQQQHGVDGGDCVYFADNPSKDFRGPKTLGWRTVRVRRAGGLHEERPSEADVDEEIADFSGLLM